ncbi:MAG: hypothetical protein LKJ88_02855 [Bacilli bacterium]|nr:hypothetical protein [Bacilli bacterium]
MERVREKKHFLKEKKIMEVEIWLSDSKGFLRRKFKKRDCLDKEEGYVKTIIHFVN